MMQCLGELTCHIDGDETNPPNRQHGDSVRPVTALLMVPSTSSEFPQ